MAVDSKYAHLSGIVSIAFNLFTNTCVGNLLLCSYKLLDIFNY